MYKSLIQTEPHPLNSLLQSGNSEAEVGDVKRNIGMLRRSIWFWVFRVGGGRGLLWIVIESFLAFRYDTNVYQLVEEVFYMQVGGRSASFGRGWCWSDRKRGRKEGGRGGREGQREGERREN